MTETKPEEPVAGTPAETEAADDVEAQKDAPAAAAADSGYDDGAGKGIGIAMFVCLLLAFCLGWIPIIGSFIAFVCGIIAIVLSSAVTCGCCCGKNLNLNPKVKRWALATLLCVVIEWVVAFIAIGLIAAAASTSTSTQQPSTQPQQPWWEYNPDEPWTWEQPWNTPPTPTPTATDAQIAGAIALVVIRQILLLLAVVFSGIFTWGRKSCGNA